MDERRRQRTMMKGQFGPSGVFDWSFVPRFHGDSFAELPTLRHVGREFDIVVWFLAYDTDAGVILYNGQGIAFLLTSATGNTPENPCRLK